MEASKFGLFFPSNYFRVCILIVKGFLFNFPFFSSLRYPPLAVVRQSTSKRLETLGVKALG